MSLEYVAAMTFEDEQYHYNALTTYGKRKLSYALAGAALDVSVDLGPYAWLEVKAKLTGGSQVQGALPRKGTLTWQVTNVDPKKGAELHIELPGQELLGKRELARWNGEPSGNQRRWMKARASSTLKPSARFNFGAGDVGGNQGVSRIIPANR